MRQLNPWVVMELLNIYTECVWERDLSKRHALGAHGFTYLFKCLWVMNSNVTVRMTPIYECHIKLRLIRSVFCRQLYFQNYCHSATL